MARVKASPGTRKLSEVAKLVVAPSGIVSTGWPAVRDLCNRKLGLEFDGWQDGTGRLILAERDGGGLASQIGGVALSLPRQVGKTYLIAAIVFALCILRPKLLVIWSAHHSTTHEETFLSMQAFADRVKIKPYIDQVFKGSGDEEIRFRNGSRILFGARERGFGRGIPGVDVIVSDEAQIMTEKAVDAQTSTLNTSTFGLAIYAGTPPRPEDPSDAFTRMRNEAWEGTLQDAVWIEVGGDPKGDPDDPKQWAKANPSYPHRTPTESILRQRRKLTLDSFRREGLGIWDDEGNAPKWETVNKVDWIACGVNLDQNQGGWFTGPLAVAVEMSQSTRATHLLVCGECAEGGPGVDLHATFPTPAGVVEHLQGMGDITVVMDPRGPAGALLNRLTEAGIEVVEVDTPSLMRGTGEFIDATADGKVRHRHRPQLDESVGRAKLRKYGESRLIDRGGDGDPAVAVGAVLAHMTHVAAQVETEPYAAVIYT